MSLDSADSHVLLFLLRAKLELCIPQDAFGVWGYEPGESKLSEIGIGVGMRVASSAYLSQRL